MIVRAGPHVWLLISQIEHARIAAEIAAVWRLPPALTGLSGEFLFAVRHHDDGWSEWEAAPTVDTRGNPRDFMEMAMPVATHLWTTSIEIAARRSPWCGLWVSRHFCHLGELALDHRVTPVDCDAARRFLEQQSALQRNWREATGVSAEVSAIETAGLHSLQFFDRVSLWLCCAERTQPQEFVDPAGQQTRWIPVTPAEIRIESGALTVKRLSLAVTTIVVPQQPYFDDTALRTAIASEQPATLLWMLRSSSAAPKR